MHLLKELQCNRALACNDMGVVVRGHKARPCVSKHPRARRLSRIHARRANGDDACVQRRANGDDACVQWRTNGDDACVQWRTNGDDACVQWRANGDDACVQWRTRVSAHMVLVHHCGDTRWPVPVFALARARNW